LNLDAGDRRERNRQQLAILSRWCATVMALPALIGAGLLVLLMPNPFLAVLIAVVVYAALGAWVYLGLRRYGATLLVDLALLSTDEVHYARLHNLTEGLCLSHGLAKPELWVIETDSRNVCTVLTGERDHEREAALIITSGLLNNVARVELEGVLAQQLSHVRDGDTALATFVAAVASIPLIGRLLARRAGACLDPELETYGDLAGVAMTRYPPGLASALGKLQGHPTVVPGVTPTGAHLWLADPLPPSSGSAVPVPTDATSSPGATVIVADRHEPFVPHPPLAERIAVLREL
jgi:heat shock protein HtpX